MIGGVVGAEPVRSKPRAAPVALRELDAVTIDAYGTLLTLRDPVGHLDHELRARGVELPRPAVERAFRAEVDFYVREHLTARDAESLEDLRLRCARVFLDAAAVDLSAEKFAPALAYQYEVLPGVGAALEALSARGLALAVAANWDFGLHEQLRRHGLSRFFAAVVAAAEVGAAKPAAAPLLVALDRLGVTAGRALHVGDSGADEQAAAAAGVHFARAPLADAVSRLA
jgi:HAD superfamily hydrolase (TIGR01509 family)